MTIYGMKDLVQVVPFIVDALTNNVNRTASDVRAAFGKMVVIWVYLVQWLICLTILQRLVSKEICR